MDIIFCLFIGFIIGFLVAVWCTCQIDKRAAKDRIIKIDGEVYKLEKINI